MQRIVVIGSGGAGKSTLSRRLGEITSIPVIHLDREHWRPGWVEPPKDEWRRRVEQLAAGGRWIMDGNFGGTMEHRLEACDAVVFLDLPRMVCVRRVLGRVIKYRGRSRPDMGEGCPERFDLKFMKWVWDFPRVTRPVILERLSAIQDRKKIFHLRSTGEVADFLCRVRSERVLV